MISLNFLFISFTRIDWKQLPTHSTLTPTQGGYRRQQGGRLPRPKRMPFRYEQGNSGVGTWAYPSPTDDPRWTWCSDEPDETKWPAIKRKQRDIQEELLRIPKAAETIQRHWRGYKGREEVLARFFPEDFAKRNGTQPKNRNSRHHLNINTLNHYDEYWSKPLSGAKLNKLGFHDDTVVVDYTEDGKEVAKVQKVVKVDFTPRGVRPLDYIVKILTKMEKDKSPLEPVYNLGDRFTINAIDIFLGDIIDTLSAGLRYCIPNHSSIKIPTAWRMKVIDFRVQFRFFMGLDHDKLPEQKPLPKNDKIIESDQDRAFHKLAEELKQMRLNGRCVLPHQLPRSTPERNSFCASPEECDLMDRLNRLIASNK